MLPLHHEPRENGALGRNLTCSLPVRSRLLYTFELQVQNGGSARDQTEDRAVIDRVLYQLSYATVKWLIHRDLNPN